MGRNKKDWQGQISRMMKADQMAFEDIQQFQVEKELFNGHMAEKLDNH